VRALAKESATATTEIENLIGNIQAQIQEIVSEMETDRLEVEFKHRTLNTTCQDWQEIPIMTAKINNLLDIISRVGSEQTQGSKAVTQTMKQVAEIADKTAQETTQVSNLLKQMLAVNNDLQHILDYVNNQV
jgi:methyl-accepting chemotaxis protein